MPCFAPPELEAISIVPSYKHSAPPELNANAETAQREAAKSDAIDAPPVLWLAVRDVLDFAVIRDGSNGLT